MEHQVVSHHDARNARTARGEDRRLITVAHDQVDVVDEERMAIGDRSGGELYGRERARQERISIAEVATRKNRIQQVECLTTGVQTNVAASALQPAHDRFGTTAVTATAPVYVIVHTPSLTLDHPGQAAEPRTPSGDDTATMR